MYRRNFPKSFSLSEAQDMTMVTEEPISTTVLSVASGTFRISRPVGQARSPGAQQDVGREQRAEQHHLGGEEQPDAQLGVVEPGVGPGLGGVRECPSWPLLLGLLRCCGVKSLGAPGRL